MSDKTAIEAGSWVRIQKPGTYHNDLAFVLDFDHHLMDVQVALVPRIRLTQKRQGRPPACLFNVEAVEEIHSHRSVQQRNQIHVFKRDEYKNGLMERCMGVHDVSDRNVNPTESELTLFAQCANPTIVKAAYQQMATFHEGDRIEVIAGQLRGLTGRIAHVNERGTAIINPTTPVPDRQVVRASELRKDYQLGDFVRVISGDHKGSKGFIVDIEKQMVTLYCLSPGHVLRHHCGNGEEVGSPHQRRCVVLIMLCTAGPGHDSSRVQLPRLQFSCP